MPNIPERGEQRAATDAGRTGDKAANFDPAAAPEHDDAEAAGTPTSATLAASSVLQQAAMRAKRPLTMAPFGANSDPEAKGHRLWMVAVALLVLILAGIVAGAISVINL